MNPCSGPKTVDTHATDEIDLLIVEAKGETKILIDRRLGAGSVPGSGGVPVNALLAEIVDDTAGTGTIEIDEMTRVNEIANGTMIRTMTGVSETIAETENELPVQRRKKQR